MSSLYASRIGYLYGRSGVRLRNFTRGNMAKFTDNRIRPRKKESGEYPWDFKAPSYDNRTSSSICAGNDYGVGFNQPVGKMKARSFESGPIPQKNDFLNGRDYIRGKDIEG